MMRWRLLRAAAVTTGSSVLPHPVSHAHNMVSPQGKTLYERVCVCGSKKPPLGDRLQKMKLFLQCIETTKVLPMFLVYV